MTFEHREDENLGALDPIDDPVRSQEHLPNVLATPLGDMAASERTRCCLSSTLAKAFHPPPLVIGRGAAPICARAWVMASRSFFSRSERGGSSVR